MNEAKNKAGMQSIGRTLMLGGIILFLPGGGVYLSARFNLPLGRLPGDIRIQREGGVLLPAGYNPTGPNLKRLEQF